MGKMSLILGGARSGKSTFAEQLAAKLGEKVVYIATAEAKDSEMVARIEVHQRERPSHWQTLEIPIQVGKYWQNVSIEADVVLLDCVTLLVTNVLMKNSPDLENIDEEVVHRAVTDEIDGLVTAVAQSDAHWLIVSNEVGLGLVPPYPLGRVYRDALGRANQQLAHAANKVYFMLAGIPMQMQSVELENI